MKIRIVFFVLSVYFLIAMQSCGHKPSSIDDIIEKYDTVDFSALTNKFISFRSGGRGRSTSIYFLRIFESDKPCTYTIEYNHESDSIIEIGYRLFSDSICQSDYIDNVEIEKIIRTYLKYESPVLGVDSEGSVYMNPYTSDQPIFLRKSPTSKKKNENWFTLYKENWYVDMDLYNQYMQ